MSSIHDQQTEDLRFRVLKLLQERPDISQRELARQLGITRQTLYNKIKRYGL